jgi:hypothetical protein
LRRLIRMAKVAAIRIRAANRNGWRDEIEGVVSGFGADGSFSGFGHVAIEALAANTLESNSSSILAHPITQGAGGFAFIFI